MKRLLTLFTLILLTVEAFGKWIFALLLVGLLGMALAQDAAPVIAGVTIPDSIWYAAAAVIGIIVKALASPLTQLLKIRLGFTGNAARLLYAVLSLLFVTGYGLVIGAFGQGGHGWLSAAVALATALVKGYGDYSKQVDTSAQGAALVTPQVIHVATPPPLLPPHMPGMENVHDINGEVIGSIPPITPVKNGLEKI